MILSIKNKPKTQYQRKTLLFIFCILFNFQFTNAEDDHPVLLELRLLEFQ